jgi:hypothetical protein
MLKFAVNIYNWSKNRYKIKINIFIFGDGSNFKHIVSFKTNNIVKFITIFALFNAIVTLLCIKYLSFN